MAIAPYSSRIEEVRFIPILKLIIGISITNCLTNWLPKVYANLKGKRGFDAYKRDEIPEEYHYRNHRLVQEIVLVAQPNFYLQGLQTSQQIPRSSNPLQLGRGAHGYANMSDMRTIFFARGPGKKIKCKILMIQCQS